jgi:hypothetical protein
MYQYSVDFIDVAIPEEATYFAIMVKGGGVYPDRGVTVAINEDTNWGVRPAELPGGVSCAGRVRFAAACSIIVALCLCQFLM